MIRDSLGDRIKKYERVYNYSLTPRSCVFIRVDGKSFHTFTRGCEKPFDQKLIDTMASAMVETANSMSGFKMAYTQSDECTFMLTDFDTLDTQGWFDYELNKILSITASTFTYYFNKEWDIQRNPGKRLPAVFDSRAFVVPKDDAPNVFVWREKDWFRNSIQMLAQSLYSQKELQGKKIADLHELLYAKGVNWTNLPDQLKNGTFYYYKEKHYKNLNYEEIKDIIFPSINMGICNG